MCDSINFMMLRRIIRTVAGRPVGRFLGGRFCHPVKLRHALFAPLARCSQSRIVPATTGSCLQERSLYNCIRSRATTYLNNVTNGTKLFSATKRITTMCRVLLGSKR